MIAKELDPFEARNDYEAAGRIALEQVARHLRKSFSARKGGHASPYDLQILNELRFEEEGFGSGVYVDHLILHRHGIILIENRSLDAAIEVTPPDNWTQVFRQAPLRIPSPVTQAERNLKFVKMLLIKGGAFQDVLEGQRSLAFDYLVSLPEKASVKLPKGANYPQLCRTDKLAERIEALLKGYRQANRGGFFRQRSGYDDLSNDELLRLSMFFRQYHIPLVREVRKSLDPKAPKKSAPEPVRPKAQLPLIPESAAPQSRPVEVRLEARQVPPESQPKSAKARPRPAARANDQADSQTRDSLADNCNICDEPGVMITHNGTEYRYACGNCKAEYMIERSCTTCGQRRYVRKSGQAFSLECERCQTSRLLYVNP